MKKKELKLKDVVTVMNQRFNMLSFELKGLQAQTNATTLKLYDLRNEVHNLKDDQNYSLDEIADLIQKRIR